MKDKEGKKESLSIKDKSYKMRGNFFVVKTWYMIRSLAR